MNKMQEKDFINIGIFTAIYYVVIFVDTLMSYMPGWILPVLAITCFVSGLVGALIGRAIFKKHFERAGMA